MPNSPTNNVHCSVSMAYSERMPGMVAAASYRAKMSSGPSTFFIHRDRAVAPLFRISNLERGLLPKNRTQRRFILRFRRHDELELEDARPPCGCRSIGLEAVRVWRRLVGSCWVALVKAKNKNGPPEGGPNRFSRRHQGQMQVVPKIARNPSKSDVAIVPSPSKSPMHVSTLRTDLQAASGRARTTIR